ncbi:hypothetical protein RIF29_15888 [Crotalaria pallida]|uniref:Uncharacterized protein n=1 Tax=Crotalaria pallida TaxID=3830 RepID=A0AAN9FFP5_CROPI
MLRNLHLGVACTKQVAMLPGLAASLASSDSLVLAFVWIWNSQKFHTPKIIGDIVDQSLHIFPSSQIRNLLVESNIAGHGHTEQKALASIGSPASAWWDWSPGLVSPVGWIT